MQFGVASHRAVVLLGNEAVNACKVTASHPKSGALGVVDVHVAAGRQLLEGTAMARPTTRMILRLRSGSSSGWVCSAGRAAYLEDSARRGNRSLQSGWRSANFALYWRRLCRSTEGPECKGASLGVFEATSSSDDA